MSTTIFDTEQTDILLTELRIEFDAELRSIMDWWVEHTIDEKQGGFIGRMDGLGKIYPSADKGVILNARLIWSFAEAARYTLDPSYQVMAERAYQYFVNHFWDQTEGGVFWMVDHEGNPSDTRKQIYAQAFAIYGLVAYYELSGSAAALEKATELFWLIEKYSLDRLGGGYRNVFERGWREASDMRLSDKDADESKIMNTHLHLLEAYASLYRVVRSRAIADALASVLDLFEQYFYRKQYASLQVYFTDDWQARGAQISYGHDIEASWLLYEAAMVLGDDDRLNQWYRNALQMAKAVLMSGLDEDGGLFNERYSDGKLDTDKHWWPQAEAVIGFWNAYQLSGQQEFRDAALSAWRFIQAKLKDAKGGEWHWRTNRAGHVIRSENKVGPWKAPYHNSRMCLEMIRRLT